MNSVPIPPTVCCRLLGNVAQEVVGMSLLTLSIFGGWEIVLILAVILIMLGAKNLPDIFRGLRLGIEEFKKATKQVSQEITHELEREQTGKKGHEYPNHLLLAGLTIILGAICVALILYNLSK